MDKSKNLSVTLDLLNDRVHFNGQTEGQAPISIDYMPPVGDNLGYTSLELLLISLESCMATALLLFLRRMGHTIDGFKIETDAERSTEHPTILTHIHMRCYFVSPDLTEPDFEKVLALAEEKYCPVYAMLAGGTKIVTTCHISKTQTK